MNTLRIIEPGLCTTVQDLGRTGHSAMGIGPAGAADPLSLRIGNRLVGNEESDAAIEMTLTGASLVIQRDALLCLTGADAPEARIEHAGDSRPLEPWTPTPVRAGSIITIGPLTGGCRALLCIDGGIAKRPVLGSRSTHLPSGVGGGALRAGDELPLGEPHRGIQTARPDAEALGQIRDVLTRRTLRIVAGAQHDRFTDESTRALVNGAFIVSDRSDRTGVRFAGAGVVAPAGSMRSEGVITGTIQVPPDGQPIVLLVDRPATGGYPAIGCIIAADLPALGQIRPRERIRFEWTDRARALELLREQDALVKRIRRPRPSGYVRVARQPSAATEPECSIDLNCDAGEAIEPAGIEVESQLLELVSSVNIACTGHAGDEASMRRTVLGALKSGCAIGAHPSYPDREGFGRRPVSITPEDLERSLAEQIASLGRIARELGAELTHVKPHGALYHRAGLDERVAVAIAHAAAGWSEDLALVGAAGSPALRVWESMGRRCIGEAFADRIYEPDGSLRARTQRDAVILDPVVAATQALRLARAGEVLGSDGTTVRLKAQTLCVHSDTPGSADIARAVREALLAEGVRILRA